MKISLSKRIVSFVLCLTVLLAGFAYKPQKAEAFAISASLVASVIMIMTACGVTFWASTQGDAESYISQKLGEYLDQLTPTPASILDWLGITDLGSLFVVLTGGVARFDSNVANKILDFVSWFNREESVVSGGDPVGILGGVTVVGTYKASSTITGSVSAQSIGDGIIRLTFAEVIDSGERYGSDFCILLSGNFDGRVSVEVYPTPTGNKQIPIGFFAPGARSLTGRFTIASHSSAMQSGTTVAGPSTSDDAFAIGIVTPGYYNTAYSGSIDFRFTAGASDVVQEREVAITPSSAVSVPDNVSDDDSFDVAPSVPLTEGMSIDDASSEIFDGVTSADGLTSTGEAAESPSLDLSGILEILGSILNAILAIPGHIAALPSAIASAFNSILSSIKSVLDSIADKVISAAESIIDGINAKLDNFIYEMEYGFSAVVSSIHRIGQDVRDALMTWLEDFITDVQSAIDTIKQTVIGIPQAIGQAASDVITGIGNAISTALYDAFVPSEAAIDAFVVTLAANFDNHFSILSYPFSLLGKFVLEVVDAPGAHELVWPDIYEPFSGQRLIAAGSYNLDTALENENFRTAYDIYMTVIKGYIAFQFIAYLYAWFCDVFRMRNDDFANPIFEQEPIDDGPDDWDGYDSFFET